MAYFYKGFKIVDRPDGTFAVIAPSIGNKMVKLTATKIEAKLWIEKVETRMDLIQASKKVDKILGI